MSETPRGAARDTFSAFRRVWDVAITQIKDLRVTESFLDEAKAHAETIVSVATERLREVLEEEMIQHARSAEPSFSKQDVPPEEIGELIARTPVWQSFQGMRADLQHLFEQVFIKAYSGEIPMDLRTVVKELRKIAEDAESRLAGIARTEMASTVNVGREIAYKHRDPENAFRYHWVGPADGRTTEICRTIKARQPTEGLPLEDLKRLVKTVATELTQPPFQPRDWLPHFQCRHTVQRIVA